MRTATLTVAHEGDKNNTWTETYREDDGSMRGLRSDHQDVEQWAREVIQYFNDTLRPGEQRRVMISVAVTDDGKKAKPQHDWHKTNAFTISDRHGTYDAMRCDHCGVTGKRFGLGSIKRDTKYRAKKYEHCKEGGAT